MTGQCQLDMTEKETARMGRDGNKLDHAPDMAYRNRWMRLLIFPFLFLATTLLLHGQLSSSECFSAEPLNSPSRVGSIVEAFLHKCLPDSASCTPLAKTARDSQHRRSVLTGDSFTPIRAAVGQKPQLSTAPFHWPVSLKKDCIATFDYDAEVAGYPYFIVSDLSGPAQIELKYTEQFDGLNHPWGDGPNDFVVALANTYRVETFNVTEPGRFESYFIQGGQRWQSFRLLTPASVTLSEIGFRSTIDMPNLDDLPSRFECSNPVYNEIWKLGANAVAASCFNAGTQKQTWEVTPDGMYIRGQKAAATALGVDFQDYKLTFESKIVRGGTGWTVAQRIGGTSLNALLISELPAESTFVNTNTSITPPNSIVISSGRGFYNQTTLTSYYWGSWVVPFPVKEGQWYNIETTLSDGAFMAISIDGIEVVKVALFDYPHEDRQGTRGSFGFGPYQDQIAYFRNATVTASDGTQLYHNDLTSEDVLAEYGTHSNWATTCVDGPERDRLVWLGDFFHTARSITSSTSRSDYVRGTFDYLIEWQIANGQLSAYAPLGYSPEYKQQLSGGRYELEDYQVLGLITFAQYYQVTGDIEFAQRVWSAFKFQISGLVASIDPSTNLSGISGFIGPSHGTATSAALAQGLNGAAVIGEDIGDHETAQSYRTLADSLAAGINAHLWNEQGGFYALSTGSLWDFSVTGLSFAITSGIATPERATSSLQHLERLKLSPGYADTTWIDRANPTENLSPNTNGFLLSALFLANDTAPVKYLLDNLWAAMLADEFRSGASWEYVAQNLSPGLSFWTSLGHPWGSAPTYVFPEFVAGLRAVKPGYKTWLLMPHFQGLGLTWAKARLLTRFGTFKAGWTLSGGELRVDIDAPNGTEGVFSLPGNVGFRTYVRDGVGVVNERSKEGIWVGGGKTTLVIRVEEMDNWVPGDL